MWLIVELAFRKVLEGLLRLVFVKSNERSEDSCIGPSDLFVFFYQEKVFKCSNNYRCAFIHIDAFLNALRYICTLGVQLNFIC